jgi:light-regulated signal transduction histidine kinase (bacteriophytochrome)
LGPGLLATVLSVAVIEFLYLPPMYSFAFEAKQDLLPIVLYLGQGAFISWLAGSHRTITASLETSKGDLERRVEQRTAALMESNISLAEQMAENETMLAEVRAFSEQLQQSNRELEDFASVASHDLQEPLRKILAFGDRLKARSGDSLSDEGRMYLDRMQNAAGRMQVLINDLLTFSRVATRAQPFERVSLGAIVREVASDLEARVDETGGRIEIGELPEVDADPTQMRQLFQNLLGNGLKFRRPDEPPIVRVSGRVLTGNGRLDSGNSASDEDAPFCEIRIEDNGIGFDEKYLDRIFNIFQRLHGRNVYEGTGIGLAVCRKIVERHGGTISARSRPNEGAAFIVTLPVEQPTAEQSEAGTQTTVETRTDGASRQTDHNSAR